MMRRAILVVAVLALAAAYVSAEGMYARERTTNWRSWMQSMTAADWKGVLTSGKHASAKFPKAIAFCEANSAGEGAKNFDTPLLRDGRKDGMLRYVKQFVDEVSWRHDQKAGTYADAAKKGALIDDADNFLTALLQLLHDATKADPPIYVSHAGDHDVAVMNIMHDVLLKIPKAEENVCKVVGFADCSKADEKNYALWVADTAHILHDVGYMGLPADQEKYAHALNGRLLIEKRLGALFKKVLRREADLEPIVWSIAFHNYDTHKPIELKKNLADKKAYFNDGKNPEFKEGDVGAIPKATAEGMKRTFQPAELGKNGQETLLALLRIADNADASRFRLTDEQRDSTILACWARLAYDEKIWDLVRTNKDDSNKAALDTQRELIRKNSKFCKAAYDAKKTAVTKANEASFLHFISNYFLTKTQAEVKNDAFTLTIEMSGTDSKDASLAHLIPANFPEAAVFQIYRMATAVESVTVNGKTFDKYAKVKISGWGVDEVMDLSAFHPLTAKKANQCAIYAKNVHRLGSVCYKTTDEKSADFDKHTPCTAHHPEFDGPLKTDCTEETKVAAPVVVKGKFVRNLRAFKKGRSARKL